MPNTKSSAKRQRQSEKRRIQNRQARSALRTAIRNVRGASGPDEARTRLSHAASLLDRAARKGLIHPNKAARHKIRLSRFVRSLQRPAQP